MRCLRLVVLFLILLSLHASGQEPEPTPSPSAALATLTGRVEDNAHRPLAGALIRLDSEQSARSEGDGSFVIHDIRPGAHRVQISRRGYRPGSGTITFAPAQSKSLLVTLNPIDSSGERPSAAAKGTLYVQAKPYRFGDNRYHAHHVEVWDPNGSGSWEAYDWNGGYAASIYLTCSGAVIGHTYTIRVTWHSKPDAGGPDLDDETTGTWYRKFSSSGQTETFYNP